MTKYFQACCPAIKDLRDRWVHYVYCPTKEQLGACDNYPYMTEEDAEKEQRRLAKIANDLVRQNLPNSKKSHRQ